MIELVSTLLIPIYLIPKMLGKNRHLIVINVKLFLAGLFVNLSALVLPEFFHGQVTALSVLAFAFVWHGTRRKNDAH